MGFVEVDRRVETVGIIVVLGFVVRFDVFVSIVLSFKGSWRRRTVDFYLGCEGKV